MSEQAQDSPRRHVWRIVLSAVLLSVGGIVAAALAGLWVRSDLVTPVVLPSGGALVAIAPGENFRTVAGRLQSAGVVRHAWTLRLWARVTGQDRFVRSGEYRFDEARSPIGVVAVLRSPATALHRVTIPEGKSAAQVMELLAAAGFGGADVFRCWAHDAAFLAHLDLPATGLEGYLFPDTYAFAWRTPPEQVLEAMVLRFRVASSDLAERRKRAGMSEHTMVTLASLIEEETGAREERALVSAVFHNRLRLGMPLQSDPTAVYGRESTAPPTAADLAAESPYNTYRRRGLPPGPICNPGRAALEAALAPSDAAFLYFVSRNDGTHMFSKSLDEHNRAVARFQRAGRSTQ